MEAIKRNRSAEQTASDQFPVLLKKWRKYRRMSQLEFSLEAGLSQRHLSFLESGRSKPSREMVLQLSMALKLAFRETNQLLFSAGFAHVFEQRDLSSEDMRSVDNVLDMMLAHHEPFPALVADRNWSLIKANDAANRLIGFIGDPDQVWQRVDPGGTKNIYRMTFSSVGMRPLIANWPQVQMTLLQRLQKEASLDPENTYLSSLYEEMLELSDNQNLHFVGEPIVAVAPVLPLELQAGSMKLKVYSMISSFGTAQDITADELKVETFFPADEITKTLFAKLAQT